MATLWLTYAWADNEVSDVDFVAQELETDGVRVKLDRWTLGAGKRLWTQIEKFIGDPEQCDAWAMYVTQNSLGSEPCKEEYAYALDRALRTRGGEFPIIGIFPASVDRSLVPAGLATRLYVSLRDPDWKERIIAAAENRAPRTGRPSIEPFFVEVHENHPAVDRRYAIEVRPRGGTWSPFFAAVPRSEKDRVNGYLRHGPKAVPSTGGVLLLHREFEEAGVWVMSAENEATPTQSYYVHCDELPSEMRFGGLGAQPQYIRRFSS